MKDFWLRSKLLYDKEGNLAEQNIYNSKGEIISKLIFFYDVNKNFVSQVTVTRKDTIRNKFYYNDDGLASFDSVFNMRGECIATGAYTYISPLQIIYEKYDPVNIFSYKIYFYYDEDLNPVNQIKQDSDNKTLLEIKYFYFGKNYSEKSIYGNENNFLYKYVYEYLGNGYIKSLIKILANNEKEFYREYYYLENGLENFVREKNVDKNKSFIVINNYEYYR